MKGDDRHWRLSHSQERKVRETKTQRNRQAEEKKEQRNRLKNKW